MLNCLMLVDVWLMIVVVFDWLVIVVCCVGLCVGWYGIVLFDVVLLCWLCVGDVLLLLMFV